MNYTTKQQYDEMVKQASPTSPVVKNCFLAFLFGGLICTSSQLLCNFYQTLSLPLKEARAAVSLTLVFIAALLTALGVYDKIARHAGAGIIVPITGFANSMVSSAIEYKSEGYVMGVGGKMFTIAGPVLVFGLSASVIYGIILYIIERI